MEAGGWRRLQRESRAGQSGGGGGGGGRGVMQLLLLDAGPLWQRIRPLQTSQAACNKQDARCHRSTCSPGGPSWMQSAQRPQVDVGGRLREFRKKTSSGRDLLQVQNGGRSLKCGNGLPVLAVGGGAGAISKFAPAAFCVIHLFRYSLLLHWNDTGKGSQVPPWTSRQFTAVQHRQILLHLRPI